MSKKILAVFGATGQQGSSVINHVLSSLTLSAEFQVRAITRDTSSSKAVTLASQVEVVQGDVSDPASLLVALKGVHTVFAMTAHSMTVPNVEYLAGKAIADATVAVGAKYLIWSTLPSVSLQTNGKYTLLTPFDEKFAVENYIRDELVSKGKIQASFLLPACFMENFTGFLQPKYDSGTGKWILKRPNSPDSLVSLIAAVEDTGKFVGSILAEPERYAGRTVNAAQGRYSYREIAEAIGKGAGKEVVYEESGEEEFKQQFGGGVIGEAFFQLYRYFEEFGLYGSDEEEVVKRAAEDVNGGKETLMGLNEYFARHPIQLEE
ncbi:NAD(P)-binding protein [Naviculisporaceae sp. PSN 640]